MKLIDINRYRCISIYTRWELRCALRLVAKSRIEVKPRLLTFHSRKEKQLGFFFFLDWRTGLFLARLSKATCFSATSPKADVPPGRCFFGGDIVLRFPSLSSRCPYAGGGLANLFHEQRSKLPAREGEGIGGSKVGPKCPCRQVRIVITLVFADRAPDA